MTTVYRLPRWAPMAGWSAFGRIGVRVGVVFPERILAHESIHIAQQQRVGIWLWHLRYVFSRRSRAWYEAEAYRQDVRRGWIGLGRATALLSGRLYLWPCSPEDALAMLLAEDSAFYAEEP